MQIVQAYKKVQYPTAAQQMTNATQAARRIAKQLTTGEPVYVPDSVYLEREKICTPCEYRDNSRCRLCGCWLKNVVTGKLRLATEKCPANPPKWNIWIKTQES